MKSEQTGKTPGKTLYSGRRRTATRRAGFTSHPDSTGGEYKKLNLPSFKLKKDESITVVFNMPAHQKGQIIGYGGWFLADDGISVNISGAAYSKRTLLQVPSPDWSKLGSMWPSENGAACSITVDFHAAKAGTLAFYELGCGIIKHKHLDGAREALLKNMYQFSPEAHFIETDGSVTVESNEQHGEQKSIHLKSCNRCARFLPININNERAHLSFSNHCVATHRRPCSHKGFGRLVNVDTQEHLQLDYGYQLECRFCKKFEVNAAHNPQRSAAQMKEDGARRRAFELLLTELFGESPQLRYRHLTGGRELSDDIWQKFSGKCFNCAEAIKTQKSMHLDHTRPLALLWPLDGTATCLCGSCNSEKRDRAPADFYQAEKLKALSKITEIPLVDLTNPTPNMEAIDLLRGRLDWFFKDFCSKPELTKERDGKIAVELLIKALNKTLSRCQGGAPFDIKSEYEKWLKGITS